MGIIDWKKIFGINYKEVNNIPLKLVSKFENNCEQKIKIMSSKVTSRTTDLIENNIKKINKEKEQIIEIDNINFGNYNGKKQDIINSLKTIRNKIDNFNLEEKCDEIINLLKKIFINEITNTFFKALNENGFKNFIGQIQNNVNEILDDVVKKFEI